MAVSLNSSVGVGLGDKQGFFKNLGGEDEVKGQSGNRNRSG
jgi:hypothetical protein